MGYPILLMYSDGSFKPRKKIIEDELSEVLGQYPGMNFVSRLKKWLWKDNPKTMTLMVETDRLTDIIEHYLSDGYEMPLWQSILTTMTATTGADEKGMAECIESGEYYDSQRKATGRQMYEKSLEIAFYLSEKMGLDVIDMAYNEYLLPGKEGHLLVEMHERAKRIPKRKKRWMKSL